MGKPNPNGLMTPAQQMTLARKKLEGFQLVGVDGDVVKIRKGNDVQIIRLNGAAHRGVGAVGNVRSRSASRG